MESLSIEISIKSTYYGERGGERKKGGEKQIKMKIRNKRGVRTQVYQQLKWGINVISPCCNYGRFVIACFPTIKCRVVKLVTSDLQLTPCFKLINHCLAKNNQKEEAWDNGLED